MDMDLSCFENKKVLLTGHTGFKGGWLAVWLDSLGAGVAGVALDPLYDQGVFERSGIASRIQDHRFDIRDFDRLSRLFAEEQPEVVFHLAAQPLVLTSYREPVRTFSTNVMGTVHVLEAIRQTPSVKAAVVVTTDKCYENKEWVYGYRENDPLGGHDPYSASKAAAELVVASYRRSFFAGGASVGLASVRAGNVIGGGDWAAHRLVPDIIRALEQDEAVDIRNPAAVRPWQFVLEPLGGYLLLAARLLEDPTRYSGAWNFGPPTDQLITVETLVKSFIKYLKKGYWQDHSGNGRHHEAGLLQLDISKARQQLGWMPVLDFEETIKMTADWYGRYRDEENMLDLCRQQIHQYEKLWKSRSASLEASLK